MVIPGVLGVLIGCGVDRDAEADAVRVASVAVERDPTETRPADGFFSDPRLQALEMAARVGDAATLRAALDDPEPRVRARAAFSLASMEVEVGEGGSGEDILDGLLLTLGDPAPEVRRDAAFALGRLAARSWGGGSDPSGVSGTPPLPETHSGVPLRGRHLPVVEAALLDALDGEGEGMTRGAMISALGFSGGQASLDALLDEEGARAEAALAAARILLRDWDGAEVEGPWMDRLAAALTDSDPTVRTAASWFFWSIPEEAPLRLHASALEGAVRALSPTDPAAIQAAEALGRVAGAESLGFWMEAAEVSSSEALRLVAVRTLGRANLLEREGVRDLLWDRVEGDPSDAVAFTAAVAVLGGFRVPAATLSRAEGFLERGDVSWPRQVPFLASVATRRSAAPVLAWTERRLGSGEGEAAAWGIEALGLLPDPPITGQLFRLFDVGGEDPHVALAVTRALNGRWERIWEGPEVLDRYLTFFEARIRHGEVPTAVQAVRALANPIFVEARPEGRALAALAHRMDEGLEARAVIREGWAAFANRRLAPFFDDGWTGEGFMELDPEAVPAAWVAREEGEDRKAWDPDPDSAKVWREELSTLGEHPLLILETVRGSLVVRLLPEEAPRSVVALIHRARAGELDGTPWHRGVPGRLVQGGDGVAFDGTGRDGLLLPLEHTTLGFGPGTLGVALGEGPPPQSGMNLFGSVLPEFGFDGGYAAVGEVVVGHDILSRMLPTDRIVQACVRAPLWENGLLPATCPE